MATVKITAVGEEVGVVLPRELLERLGLGEGDAVEIVETEQGIELRVQDPAISRQMDVAEGVMEKRRAALEEIAR